LNPVKLVCSPFNTEHSFHMIQLHITHNNIITILSSHLAILVGIASPLDILLEIASLLDILLEIANPLAINLEILSLAILPEIASHPAILVEMANLSIQWAAKVVGIPARKLKLSNSPHPILNSGVQRRCVTGC